MVSSMLWLINYWECPIIVGDFLPTTMHHHSCPSPWIRLLDLGIPMPGCRWTDISGRSHDQDRCSMLLFTQQCCLMDAFRHHNCDISFAGPWFVASAVVGGWRIWCPAWNDWNGRTLRKLDLKRLFRHSLTGGSILVIPKRTRKRATFYVNRSTKKKYCPSSERALNMHWTCTQCCEDWPCHSASRWVPSHWVCCRPCAPSSRTRVSLAPRLHLWAQAHTFWRSLTPREQLSADMFAFLLLTGISFLESSTSWL